MKNKLSLILIFSFLLFACESSDLEDPTTVISFSIPEESYVKMVATNSYDVVIKVLVDGNLPKGFHNIHFEMVDLAEGTYFVTIETTGVKSGKKYKATKTFYLVK